MSKRAFVTLAVALSVSSALALAQEQGDGLAGRLPADKTVVYAQLDVGRSLEEGEKLLRFIDPDAGEKVIYQVGHLYGLVRELAGGHEFRPALLDTIEETKLHFVLMAKDEPEVTTHTFKTPKYDEETFEEIPGESEEHTYTEKNNFTASLVAEVVDEETAADFIEEFKALLDRQEEDRKDYEVESGELIGPPDGDETLGCIGNYIVFSSANPKELWASLMAAPETRIADTSLYGNFAAGENLPEGFIVVNLHALFQRMEKDLKDALDEAEKKYGQKEGGAAAGPFFQGNWQLQMARMQYETYMRLKELLSLDKLDQVGVSAHLSVSEGEAQSECRLVLAHGEPISPVLKELLDGSGSFQLPAGLKGGSLYVMSRINLRRLYDETTGALREAIPQQMFAFDMAMQMMKARIGVDLGEILALLDSDSYFAMDMVRKEHEVTDWVYNEETEDWDEIKEKKMDFLPEVTLLWGLADAHSAGATLASVFTRLAADPAFNQHVKKRTYQETDVYCFGLDAAKPESYPDGTWSYAVVVVDRYLTFGSWDYVTGVIRRMKSRDHQADSELQQIVEAHRDANFLLVVRKAFQQKIEEMMAEAGGTDKDMWSLLLEEIDLDDLDIDDEDLEQRMEAAVRELILAVKVIDEKADALAPETSVVSGSHRGAFYEFGGTSTVTK